MARRRKWMDAIPTSWVVVAAVAAGLAAANGVGPAALAGRFHGPAHVRTVGSCQNVAAGQVAAWIDDAGHLLHRRWTAQDCRDLMVMIDHESGGRADPPPPGDGNACGDTRGILQACQSTFDRNAPPGCAGRITYPPCNIAACYVYAVGRYHSLHQVPGLVALRAGLPYVGY